MPSEQSHISSESVLATPMSITPVDTPYGSSESLSSATEVAEEKKKASSLWPGGIIGVVGMDDGLDSTSKPSLDTKEEDDLEKDILPPPVVSPTRTSGESTLTPLLASSKKILAKVRAYTMVDVDPTRCPIPLAAYCFMTGFVNCVCYSSAFIWPAFHTGNVVQMAEAVGRLTQHPSFRLADRLSLTSLLTFLCGAFVAGQIGSRLGHSTRAWLFFGTLLQVLTTTAAAICAWKSGQPVPASKAVATWTNALSFASVGFMSATLGLQGVMSMRLKSPFGLTILMTGFWCELVSDPKIFQRRHKARDRMLIAIGMVFIGGFAARAILQRIGASGALGVGAAMRILIAFMWLLAPGKPGGK